MDRTERLAAALQEHLPFFEKLQESERSLLIRRSRFIQCKAGQNIRDGQANCLGVLLPQKGIFRIYLLSEDGKEATIDRLRPGNICVLTASCILEAVSFEVEIDAEVDSSAVLIPADAFRQITHANIYAENYLYKMAAECFSEVMQAVERMLFFSLEQRVCLFLLDESAVQKSMRLNVTREQIARSIGSARESVSRVVKQLSLSGAVKPFRGGIEITDHAALQAVSPCKV